MRQPHDTELDPRAARRLDADDGQREVGRRRSGIAGE
jgi:hypothetical protein